MIYLCRCQCYHRSVIRAARCSRGQRNHSRRHRPIPLGHPTRTLVDCTRRDHCSRWSSHLQINLHEYSCMGMGHLQTYPVNSAFHSILWHKCKFHFDTDRARGSEGHRDESCTFHRSSLRHRYTRPLHNDHSFHSQDRTVLEEKVNYKRRNNSKKSVSYLASNPSQSIVHRRYIAAVASQNFHDPNSLADSASPRCQALSSRRPSSLCRTCRHLTCIGRVQSISGLGSPLVRSVRPCSRESSGSFHQHSRHVRCSWPFRTHPRADCTPCLSSQSCKHIRR